MLLSLPYVRPCGKGIARCVAVYGPVRAQYGRTMRTLACEGDSDALLEVDGAGPGEPDLVPVDSSGWAPTMAGSIEDGQCHDLNGPETQTRLRSEGTS